MTMDKAAVITAVIEDLRVSIARIVGDDLPMTIERAAQVREMSERLTMWCQEQKHIGASAVSDTEPDVPEADTTVPDTVAREEFAGLGDVWQPWQDATRNTYSGLATKRDTPHRVPRLTAFVDLVANNGCTERGRWFGIDSGLAGLLNRLPDDVTRVYIVGPRDVLGANAAEVREWFLHQDPGPEWQTAPSGHYLDAAARTPIGRWRHVASDRQVEVARAATWFGDDATDIKACAAAWHHCGNAISSAFGKGAAMLSTPATTGRDLWRRTIPKDCEFPVLSAEWREIIARTSGQGRNEVVHQDRGQLPGLVHLDGRWMYAALTWGLPVGKPQIHDGGGLKTLSDAETAELVKRRGRWQITATVPDNWQHVGLLMAPTGDGDDDARWYYPRVPGESFTTWADACEVQYAMSQGWGVDLHVGITWAEGKPLNTWTDKLKRVRAELGPPAFSPEVSELCAAAIRAILLYAIGAFASRTHPVTHTVDAARPELVPAGTVNGVRRVGNQLVYETPGVESAWVAEQAHPEWSATVWARARHRLLSHRLPGGGTGGALSVPMDRVVAFRTDAIYLTTDPGWPDDGGVGRFRVKGKLSEAVPEPSSVAELFGLRDRAFEHWTAEAR